MLNFFCIIYCEIFSLYFSMVAEVWWEIIWKYKNAPSSLPNHLIFNNTFKWPILFFMLICSWCNNCTVALYSLGFFVSLWPHIYLFIAKIIFLENLYVQLLEQLCFLHYMCMYIFIYKYAIVTINDMRTCSVLIIRLALDTFH